MTNQMPVAWMYDWETPEGEFVKGMTTDDFASFAGEPIGRISNIRPLYFAQPQQDTYCKRCTNGCVACDARKVTNVLP